MRKMYYVLLLATATALMSGCAQKQTAPETAASEAAKAAETVEATEAAETAELPGETVCIDDEALVFCVAQPGVVTAIDAKSGAISIRGMLAGSGTEQELILNTDAKTAFYDIAAGKKAELSALKVGDEIQSMVSTAFASSLPPQTFAYAVFLNVGEELIPEYAELTSVQKDGEKLVLTDSSQLRWVISADTELRRLSDGGQLKGEELKEGVCCLIWPALEAVSENPDAGLATEKLVLID